MGLLDRLLGRPRMFNIPILGISAAGKTCFSWGVGAELGINDWGGPTDDTSDYWDGLHERLLTGSTGSLAATIGKRPMRFEFKQRVVDRGGPVYERAASLATGAKTPRWIEISKPTPDKLVFSFKRPLVLSTHDISGGDFRSILETFNRPVAVPRADDNVRSFIALLEHAEGVVVVVDLARDVLTKEQYRALSLEQRKQHLLAALAEQVQPLCRGVREVIRVNGGMRGKPVYFVVTKSDIHGHTQEQVENLLLGAYATLIERLRREEVFIRVCCTAYSVTVDNDTLKTRASVTGVREFLEDLALFRIEQAMQR